MADTPRIVLDYLAALVVETRSPAWIRTDDGGRVTGWGGDTAAYRLSSLAEGEPAGLVLPAIEGLLPHSGDPLRLPAVELNSSQFVDVHVFGESEQSWVLLTDATLETTQQAMLQQRLNEVNLVRGWHVRAADDQISRLDASGLVGELPAFSEEGERLEVAAAQIRFTVSLPAAPELASDDLVPLGRILRAIAEAATNESGYVTSVTQGSLSVLFGVLPAGATPQTHAVRAVLAAAESFRALECENATMAAGIASGFVSAGIVQVAGSRVFLVSGDCVRVARRLASNAGPGRLLMDEATRCDAGDPASGAVSVDGAFSLIFS